jgi:hypothetical protein
VYHVKEAGIAFATMADLQNRQRETLEATAHARIYLLNDGQPVAGLVNLRMMKLLEEVLGDRALARLVAPRLTALERGDDELLDEDAFFAAADAKMAERSSADDS